ncbi:hypothetical protein BJY00DRAFT_238069 [Aspergillus carlsbadensis]|nr:hypothetical protein BJY00DRAFT_238069 [Aspergillus carlsbadensis]
MHRRQPPRRYACTRCVKLKVKCLPTEAGQCQRCIRLGHPTCVFPKDVRGNNASKSPQTPTPSNSSQNRGDEFVFHEKITPQLAEELLDRYRNHKMPQFPFVIIPPTTDLATLRQESPFLLLCIITACLEQNPPLQDSLELLVRKEIASRVIVGIERNMDLLQGLLVHIAWQHYHWRTYHTHMYMLLPIATMIVVDLGFDREECFRMQPIPAEDRELEQPGSGQVQSAAGQRALLGCYYQCSKSSIFRRQLYMRHTKWIEHCAESLALKPEYPTDAQLKVYLDVRSLSRENDLLLDDKQRTDCFESWKRIFDRISQRQAETNALLSSLTSENDWSLRLKLGGLPALVLGHALRRRSDVFSLRDANQLDVLTKSAHNIIDMFLIMPSSVAVCLPSSSYGTIWYCLLLLAKLSLLFPAAEGRILGVDYPTIRTAALGVIAKLQSLSVGEDVWHNAVAVQEKMLSWLERAGSDPPSLFHSPRKQAGYAGDKALSLSNAQWIKEMGEHRGGQNNISTPSAVQAASIDTPYALPNDMDSNLWQQMLDSFTWFGPGMDNDLSFLELGNAI